MLRGVRTSRQTIGKWRASVSEPRGHMDLVRRAQAGNGALPSKMTEVMALLKKTLGIRSPGGHMHWSCRSLGRGDGAVKVPRCTTSWTAFNIQPHRQNHSKLSSGPFFAEKVLDIWTFVGLYINLPLSHTSDYAHNIIMENCG